MAGSEWSYDMISSDISMKLGILWIDPDRVIFQKSVVGILYGYSIFSVISFSDRCLVFGILNYWSSSLCSGLSGFSLSSVFWLILGATLSMQYGGNSIAKLCHQSVLFGIIQRFIQPEVQRTSIFWLLFSRLESPTYSDSYLNWYNSALVPLCSIYPLSKLRGRNFL